ncbi:hypothetical protein PCASD_22177 [Puccinia coronata f. sp. avenae]|uniref:Uncharacterized protein n=1 Tax=Puccinia coronata f. sp. avenae TaxID=200324 RepID=A0A2N5SR84_9BASI|nr:hypothetical protein PCASD_22177 [Puccinia coronata f. sp. avenae]
MPPPPPHALMAMARTHSTVELLLTTLQDPAGAPSEASLGYKTSDSLALWTAHHLPHQPALNSTDNPVHRPALAIMSALSIAGAFLTAHPLKTNDLLAPRYTGSITTTTTATASYQSLTTRIQTIRQNIATGQYSYTEVQTQVESFSYEVSTTLTAINDCANCFRPESVSSLKQTAQQTYAELDLLIDTCHRAYPQQAPSLFAMGSWSQLDTHLHRNLERFSESGVHATSILPPTFVKNTARVNWGRTSNFVNHQFGGSRGF